MRRTVTLSTAVAILCAALGFLTSASSEVAPINISGPWIIDGQNGPSPVCGFEQAGNNLTGSCIGPNAKGTITGTIIGEQVRWHWQWVTYAGNVAAAFDFIGTLRPDNTIKGMIERRDIGLSVNFTAKRQFVVSDKTNRILARPAEPAQYTSASGPSPLAANPALTTPAQFNAGKAQQQLAQIGGARPQPTGQPAGQQPGQPAGQQEGRPDEGPPWATTGVSSAQVGANKYWNQLNHLYGKDAVDAARMQFPWASQQPQLWESLEEGRRAALDRQQGHSYSIHVK